MRVPIQQLFAGHNHSGRAEPALESVFGAKRFLDAMKLPIHGHSLNGDNVRAVGLNGEHGATLNRSAIYLHGAGAAQRRFATDVRTGQPGDLAQEMDQKQARLDLV
jgi:hypothetical protein